MIWAAHQWVVNTVIVDTIETAVPDNVWSAFAAGSILYKSSNSLVSKKICVIFALEVQGMNSVFSFTAKLTCQEETIAPKLCELSPRDVD